METLYRALCKNYDKLMNIDICGCVVELDKLPLTQSTLCICGYKGLFCILSWTFVKNHNTVTNIEIGDSVVELVILPLTQCKLYNVFVATKGYFVSFHGLLWNITTRSQILRFVAGCVVDIVKFQLTQSKLCNAFVPSKFHFVQSNHV